MSITTQSTPFIPHRTYPEHDRDVIAYALGSMTGTAPASSQYTDHQWHTLLRDTAVDRLRKLYPSATDTEIQQRFAEVLRTLAADQPDEDPEGDAAEARCGASTKTNWGRTWCWRADVPHKHHHNAYGFTWTD